MVMSQQPVSESVWMNHYRCATLAHVSRRFSGQVEIVPGAVGPEQIIDQRPALLTPDGGVDIQLDIRFDPRQRRYLCHEVRATSSTGAAVTTEAHFYRYGYAVSYNPTKAVQESLQLLRSTADRWVAPARKAGYRGAL
jgi:hypothetical protein